MDKAALIILDGWGERDEVERNAVFNADTPNYDRLKSEKKLGLLKTYGRSVGLIDGVLGNSEVGHLTLGSGRIVNQPISKINSAIEDGSFFKNDVLEYAVKSGRNLHFMGLVSDGGIHSYQKHLHALLELADKHDRSPFIHAFLDGRDTPPKSAKKYIERLENKIESSCGVIATVSGRYYGMDRDERWERTKKVYDAIVNREGKKAKTAIQAIEKGYNRDETDEFISPTTIEGGKPLEDGDSVVFFNFRGDRTRQITDMLNGLGDWRDMGLDIDFVTMTEYDKEYSLPVAFYSETPKNTLGEVISNNGLSQFRIAETEKYAHVTYFLNGGREKVFKGEKRQIIPSPDVSTYDVVPEMKAYEVTEKAKKAVDNYDFLVLNYANPDMVGHTGDYRATIKACEVVDECVGDLTDSLLNNGYEVIIVADHGNAEDMGTEQEPHTAHTFNPTPFIYLNGTGRIEETKELRDIAPTILDLIGIDIPKEMTGKPLV